MKGHRTTILYLKYTIKFIENTYIEMYRNVHKNKT